MYHQQLHHDYCVVFTYRCALVLEVVYMQFRHFHGTKCVLFVLVRVLELKENESIGA